MATQYTQINDAIWYIHKYWNGFKVGGYFEFERKLSNGTKTIHTEKRKDVPYFPYRIYTVVLMSPYEEEMETISDYLPEYLCYELMPVVMHKLTALFKKFFAINVRQTSLYLYINGWLIMWRTSSTQEVSAWTNNELEYLRAREFPVCISNDDSRDTEFVMYLSRAFNGSFIWSKKDFYQYRRATFFSTFCTSIQIIPRRLNGRQSSGALAYFQETHKSKFRLVTASGLRNIITFVDYFLPFEKYVWIVLILTLILIASILKRVFSLRKIKDSVMMMIFSFLIEQGYQFSHRVEQNECFRGFLVPVLLMFIVLTNGYKGVVTMLLVKPFDATGLESLEQALEMRYTLYYNPDVKERYEFCCNKTKGLAWPIPIEERRYDYMRDCSDLVFNSSFMYRLLLGSHNYNWIEFLLQMSEADGRRNLNKQFSNNSHNAKLMLDMISLAEPVPCFSNQTINATTLKLNSIYIGNKPDVDSMLLRKTFGDESYSELYSVNDITGAIVEELFGYYLTTAYY